jgi:hypothetical protein
MYPNLFVIGAARSGTSSLHHYLGLHPEIHMSVPKEPHFFSRSPDGRWPGGRRFTDSAYQRLFESPLPVRGESSVTYSYFPYPAGVPARIAAVAPDARFIYLLRDPVERAVSHYRWHVAIGRERRSLAEVAAAPNDAEERYLAASSYATQLGEYVKVFRDDRVLVLDSGDLQERRGDTLRHVFAFLGVEASFSSAEFANLRNVSARDRRITSAGKRIALSPVYRRATRWIPPATRHRLTAPARALLSRPVPEIEASDEVRAVLAERLAPEAAQLRRMTGKAFPTWSV